MGLSRTGSEIDGDTVENPKFFPPLCIFTPLMGFPLELVLSDGQKSFKIGLAI